MKFRIKVLLISLVVLSVSLGIIGYLMVRKNYDLAVDNTIENAITENNLIQASVEYELLKAINNSSNIVVNSTLNEIGGRTSGSLISDGLQFFIRYDESYVYESEEGGAKAPDSLFEDMTIGKKNYIFMNENGKHYIYVSSFNPVNSKGLFIISKRNIDSVYSLLDTLITYYRIIIAVVLVIAGGLLLFISRLLTKPLERLNDATEEITKGNYGVRTDIHTNDEIGLLADKFNIMAEAVDNHVKELGDMIKRREQFVADFTHEIKTPMTAIIGYADTLRSVNLDKEDQMMAYNYIFSEGKRLEKMSGKLFDLIYLRSNEIEKKPLHSNDLINEIKRITEPMLDKKNIRLIISNVDAVINADKELLITAFVNIIDNARKASDEGSSITLSGKPEAGKYVLSVSDHGIGMTEEQITKICDEFYMADKSRSRKEGGAGLGMSLTAIILERHGATLKIESKVGEGTCMTAAFEAVEVKND